LIEYGISDDMDSRSLNTASAISHKSKLDFKLLNFVFALSGSRAHELMFSGPLRQRCIVFALSSDDRGWIPSYLVHHSLHTTAAPKLGDALSAFGDT
jgi:hypothetical protein